MIFQQYPLLIGTAVVVSSLLLTSCSAHSNDESKPLPSVEAVTGDCFPEKPFVIEKPESTSLSAPTSLPSVNSDSQPITASVGDIVTIGAVDADCIISRLPSSTSTYKIEFLDEEEVALDGISQVPYNQKTGQFNVDYVVPRSFAGKEITVAVLGSISDECPQAMICGDYEASFLIND